MGAEGMFGPLSGAERNGTGGAGRRAPGPKLTPIMPVSDDARPLDWHHPQCGRPVKTWLYLNADGKLVAYSARVEYVEDGERKKDVYPVLWCRVEQDGRDYCAWRAKGVPAPRPLYNLPALLASPDARIVVCEGEKPADKVAELFPGCVGTTSMGGAKSPHKSDWAPLAERHVTIWGDHDEAGLAYARECARLAIDAGAAFVAIVTIPQSWPEGWDLADPLPEGVTRQTLARLLTEAPPWAPPARSSSPHPERPDGEAVDDDAEIERLAKLSPIECDRELPGIAEKLRCRVPTLRAAVNARRSNGSAAPGQGRPLDLSDPEPWPDPVDGAELLDELVASIRRHVVLAAREADAVALWVLAVYAVDAWKIFPRLFVTAPEKQCGTTTLLDVLSRLVPKPLGVSSITPAALFRTIEAVRPTLLLDEADAYARENEDLRAVLDAGHRRDGTVIRTVGDNHEPRQFSVWAPVSLAAIGHLPGTIEDRSITVRLHRRRQDEPVESLRLDHSGGLDELARKAARWAADHRDLLVEADPTVPAGIYNRAADNWRPLLAIAAVAGGEWPDRASDVAVTLTRGSAEDDDTTRTMLLADLRELFNREPSGVLFTREILAALHKDETRPWPEWKNGKPMTDRQLAALLKDLGIKPKTVRRGSETDKGYKFEWFEDVFARYLTPLQSVTASQVRNSAAFEPPRSVTTAADVTDKHLEKSSISAGCDGVTDRRPLYRRDDAGEWPERDPEEAVWTE